DPAAAAGDRDRAAAQQRTNRLQLDYLEGKRRGNDAPPAAAGVMDDPPLSLALELVCARLVVERPDRLRRLGEGWIVVVDHDMREQARDRAARDRSQLA